MKRRGFTLMEVMMSVGIFTPASLMLLGAFLGSAHLSESNRNLTRAMNDGRVVLEAIRQTSSNGLATVRATDWRNWALSNGLNSLGSESVVVTFPDPAADPMPVTMQVQWQEQRRTKSIFIQSLITRR